MTKKVPKKILRIERNFFVNFRKKCFWPPAPRRRRRRFFWTGGAPPPTEIDRRAAADTMTSAHSSRQNEEQTVLYCIVSVHLYSASCSAHQTEALPVRETQREESSLERTKRGTRLTS